MKNLLPIFFLTISTWAVGQGNSNVFLKNHGQVFDLEGKSRADILFYKKGPQVDMFFLNDRISYVFKKWEGDTEQPDSLNLKLFRVDWKLENANLKNLKPKQTKRLPINFYKGDVAVEGVTGANKLVYENIYEGVDLVFYLNEENVKYDFLVQNEKGLQKIKSHIEGAKTHLDADGNLNLICEAGTITDERPISFNAQGREIESEFAIDDDHIAFRIAENSQFPIRIDPEVVFSTYFGGNTNNEYSRGVALDDSSNTYIAGQTASTNFPTTTGAFQTSLGGSTVNFADAFISKFYPSGQLAWSTYYGGTSQDYATSLDVDLNGVVHIIGQTSGSDFPTTSNAYNKSQSSTNDAFYVKLKNDGSQLYSTYLGGNRQDFPLAISVSHTLQAYLFGYTASSNFPVTSGAYQSNLAGNYDNFICKFDYDGDLEWSSYFGGSNNELNSGGLKASNSGKFIAFTGQTNSTDFPTKNAWQDSLASNQFSNQFDAFVVKMDSTGSLEWSTYMGGINWDYGKSIDFTSDGKIVAGGQHYNSSFPTKGAGFNLKSPGFQNSWLAILTADGFPTKIATWGGNRQEDLSSLVVDSTDKIHFAGFTYSSNLPKTADAFQKKNSSFLLSSELYYTICDTNWAIEYCTYLGGNASYEFEPRIDVDPNRNFVLAGGANGTDYPTKNAYQSKNNNFNDAIITKFTCNYEPEFNVKSFEDTICRGDSVVLKIDSTLKKYTWTGIIDNDYRAVLSNKGSYYVTVEDSNGCSGGTDTFFLSLYRSVNPTISALGATTVCDDEIVELTANTKWADSWKWNTGATKKKLNVAKTGDYFIMTTDSNSCVDTSNTIKATVIPKPYPSITSNTGSTNFCKKYKQIQLDAGKGYNAYQWSTGATTQDITVTKTGWYSVRVFNGLGCSEVDSVFVEDTKQKSLSLNYPSQIKFCKEDSVKLKAPSGFKNLQWSNGTSGDSIYITNPQSIYLSARDSNGCLDTSNSINISIIKNKVKINLSQQSPFCDNDTITLAIDTGLVNYNWNTGDTTRRSSVSQSGVYYVTATSVQGCKISSDTVSIQMLPKQNVSLKYSGKTEICEDDNFNVSFQTNSFSSFQWSNGNTTSTNLTLNKGGNYYVKTTDTNGCENFSDTVKLVVNKLPQVFLNSTNGTAFCDKDSTILKTNRSFNNYQWNVGSSSSSLNVFSDGKYWVKVTDNNGCKNFSDTLTISTKALPDTSVKVSGSTEFCDEDSVVLELNQSPQSILWSNGNSGAKQIIKTSRKMKAILTAANGCVDSTRIFNIVVNANPSPKLQITGSRAFCKGNGNTQLYVNDKYEKYIWNTNSTDTLISVTNTGNYWLLAESSKGCKGYSDTFSISVYDLPKPEISASNGFTFCDDDSSILATTKSYSKYFWSTLSTQSSITAKQSGNFSVLVTDSNGCTGSDRVKITVNPRPSVFSIQNNYKNSFCNGDTAKLSAPSSATSYKWNTGSTNQNINATSTDTYFVSIQNQFSCERSDSLFIYVGKPSELKTFNDTSFCLGDSFYVEADAGYSKYEWSTGQSTQNVSIKSSETLYLTTTDSIGCVFNTDTFYTNARPLQVPVPNASAGSITEFCKGDSVILEASSGYARYVWNNGDETQKTTVKRSGTYEVLVYDQNNCRGRSPEIDVTVFPNPQPVLTYNTLDTCLGDTIYISTEKVYDLMLWSTQESKDTIAVTSSENIALTVYDTNQCLGQIGPIRAEIRPVPSFDIDTVFYSGICSGDSMQLKLEPSTAISYIQWQDNKRGQSRTFFQKENIHATVFNRFGCSTTSDTIKAVFYDNPKPEIRASRGDSFCADGLNQLRPRKNYELYAWSTGDVSPSIQVKNSGTFYLQVTDTNGCFGNDSFKTTQLPVPKVVLNLADSFEFCDGDTVQLASVNRHFQYQWSTGAENRFIRIGKKGDYWLRAFNIFGCSAASDTLWGEKLELPFVDLNRTDSAAICAADSLSLRTNQSFSKYEWSNGKNTPSISVKDQGRYWVRATSAANGCSNTSDTFSLAVNELPSLNLAVNEAAPYCEGDTIILTANTSAQDVRWNNLIVENSIEVFSTGEYSVIAVDQNNCKALDSLSLVFNESPEPPRMTQKLNTLFAGTDADEYQWYFNGQPLGGAFEDTLDINAKGLYSLEASTGNCSVISKEYYFAPLDSAGSLYFEAFPNPNNGSFNLNVDVFTLENSYLQIIDSRGDLIYEQNLGKGNLNNVRIEAPELRQGIYLLRIKNGSDFESSQMVVY